MNMTNKLKKWVSGILITLSLLLVLFCIFHQPVKPTYRLALIKVKGGWGYVIYQKEKAIICQDIVPALSINEPFPTEKSALETAKRVIDKLTKNQLPALSSSEINSILRKTER
jgi:hypothetical protein